MTDIYAGYPQEIIVNFKKYPIDSDFRLMMNFELCVQKNNKRGIAEIIVRFYRGSVPDDINDAVRGMINFYLCGEQHDSKNTGDNSRRRCYDFGEDWKYISAAFRQQYGVDLVRSDMHWYEFSALFSGLTDETEFVKIMQYRCTDLKKIKNKEEKNRIRRLQQRYALSENRVKHYASAAERDAAMINDLKNKLLRK